MPLVIPGIRRFSSYSPRPYSTTESNDLHLPLATLAAVAGMAILLIYLVRVGWVAEDAYISFRTIDNFLSGYGLRWNIDERVQVYTDPLYVFLVTVVTWISGNMYLSSVLISLLLTLGTYYLMIRGRDEVGIVLVTALLLFSRSFMDFSVSGLENPATHLAIAGFLYYYWRNREPFRLTLIASLATTNRMDAILFFLPALAFLYFQIGRKVWKVALLGWMPFFLWEFISLFYYGFLFPNTAAAKLHTGIGGAELFSQGIAYVLNAVRTDTVTMIIIVIGLLIAFVARQWAIGLGILLYVVYTIRVGGDFMSGRFFTAPFTASVILISRYWRPKPLLAAAALGMLLLVSINLPPNTIPSATEGYNPIVDQAGIANERVYYYQSTGLLHYQRDTTWPGSKHGQELRASGAPVDVFGNIGLVGYYAGPTTHIIDYCGLGDAFLARLPVRSGPWRIGHYIRDIPAGYVETIKTGKNQISDPALHEYYDHLRPLIQGDLWSWVRFKEIVAMNLGLYEHLLPQRIL